MNIKKFSIILFLFAASFFLSSTLTAQETVSFSSGNKKVQVIELYSSQGCSSCPPAENWLNKFSNDKRLWTEIVPLGFHVDYWDRLGWKDPFGSKEFTLRQYAHRKENNIDSVYTPGFVVNGSEWRGWFQGGSLPEEDGEAGVLITKITGSKLEAEYSEKISKLELNYAVLGFNLKTAVTRGENSGRTLIHDFVVLEHRRAVASGGSWTVELPSPASLPKSEKYGIAVWINKSGDLEPIQATGGWLPSSAL